MNDLKNIDSSGGEEIYSTLERVARELSLVTSYMKVIPRDSSFYNSKKGRIKVNIFFYSIKLSLEEVFN